MADGRPLYRHVADYVQELAQTDRRDQCGYGSVGAVVGATLSRAARRVARRDAQRLVPRARLWKPGGRARDVAAAFDERGLGAIVNNSRAIIFAHERREYAREIRRGTLAGGRRSRHARDDRRPARPDDCRQTDAGSALKRCEFRPIDRSDRHR